MPVILLVSASGSPGVTATGIGLCMGWPGGALLVDANQHPTQAILAGYLHGIHTSPTGLQGLTQAAREGRALAPLLPTTTMPLTTDGRCQFLPGFTNPGAATVFAPLWPRLAQALVERSRDGVPIMVDIGRIGADGPLPGLIGSADVVLVVTRAHLPALAGLRIHLPILQEVAQRAQSTALVGLLVIGPGRSYSIDDIEKMFGLSAWISLPYDPEAAAVLAEGAAPPRNFPDSHPYVQALREAVTVITNRIQQRQLRIEGAA